MWLRIMSNGAVYVPIDDFICFFLSSFNGLVDFAATIIPMFTTMKAVLSRDKILEKMFSRNSIAREGWGRSHSDVIFSVKNSINSKHVIFASYLIHISWSTSRSAHWLIFFSFLSLSSIIFCESEKKQDMRRQDYNRYAREPQSVGIISRFVINNFEWFYQPTRDLISVQKLNKRFVIDLITLNRRTALVSSALNKITLRNLITIIRAGEIFQALHTAKCPIIIRQKCKMWFRFNARDSCIIKIFLKPQLFWWQARREWAC